MIFCRRSLQKNINCIKTQQIRGIAGRRPAIPLICLAFDAKVSVRIATRRVVPRSGTTRGSDSNTRRRRQRPASIPTRRPKVVEWNRLAFDVGGECENRDRGSRSTHSLTFVKVCKTEELIRI